MTEWIKAAMDVNNGQPVNGQPMMDWHDLSEPKCPMPVTGEMVDIAFDGVMVRNGYRRYAKWFNGYGVPAEEFGTVTHWAKLRDAPGKGRDNAD